MKQQIIKTMKKSSYMVYVEDERNPFVKHLSREKAEKEAQRIADILGKQVYVLEVMEEVGPKEINKTVTSFDEAIEYLNKSGISPANVISKHSKAMDAMYDLITIAEAWNKADNFVPDFDNRNQDKHYPWFYKEDAGFVCSFSVPAASPTYAYFGSRLCFKTSERAKQFGEQFIDLWNDFLLFR